MILLRSLMVLLLMIALISTVVARLWHETKMWFYGVWYGLRWELQREVAVFRKMWADPKGFWEDTK
jgi:hypothetical protein